MPLFKLALRNNKQFLRDVIQIIPFSIPAFFVHRYIQWYGRKYFSPRAANNWLEVELLEGTSETFTDGNFLTTAEAKKL